MDPQWWQVAGLPTFKLSFSLRYIEIILRQAEQTLSPPFSHHCTIREAWPFLVPLIGCPPLCSLLFNTVRSLTLCVVVVALLHNMVTFCYILSDLTILKCFWIQATAHSSCLFLWLPGCFLQFFVDREVLSKSLPDSQGRTVTCPISDT